MQKTGYEKRISDWSSDECSSDLRRARRTAAVVAPAGLAPHIAELVLPRRRPHIRRDPDPFMHCGPQYIEAAQLLDDAIAHRLVVAFDDEAAEHPVPDDETAGIIGVEVARVEAMMDAVVRRGVHHRLEPFRQPLDRLGMDPELIRQGEPRRKETFSGRK